VLDALAGAEPQALAFLQAELKNEFKSKTGLTRFLPAKLAGNIKRPEVELIRWQGSGDLMAASRANCYIVVPPDKEQFRAGEMITVLMS
jgi:molybdopterin molybdotransferase